MSLKAGPIQPVPEETMQVARAALNELATIAPDWIAGVAPEEWYQRYSRRIEDDRLPQSNENRTAYAQTVGEDGFMLLAAC
jgi:transposase